MFADYFAAGGPVMYALLVVWVIVLASVLDRLLFGITCPFRRVPRVLEASALQGGPEAVQQALEEERRLACRGLRRIDSLSQLATSLGLFGTVLGISKSFFARGGELGLSAPDVLASGLATALFTTVAGLVVFLVGQAFLILYQEWLTLRERRLESLAEEILQVRGQDDG